MTRPDFVRGAAADIAGVTRLLRIVVLTSSSAAFAQAATSPSACKNPNDSHYSQEDRLVLTSPGVSEYTKEVFRDRCRAAIRLEATGRRPEAKPVVPSAPQVSEIRLLGPLTTFAPEVEKPMQWSAVRTARGDSRTTQLAGTWNGTFTFRGTAFGSYAGEIVVAVDGDGAQVADLCPVGGGTLTATGSGNTAAWRGNLVCPAISLPGCPSVVFTYNFATATLNGSTLTLVAAGTVGTPAGCGDSSGAITVTFLAQKS